MTITLEAIEEQHGRVAAMIAAFKKQAQATEYHVASVTIPLAAGEQIAGAILNDDGTLSHYVILLPGQADDVSWTDAGKWAEQQGGSLPTRREQSLLFANLKHEFEERAYWSGEQHAENSGWAWFQYFGYGGQNPNYQGCELRARAVRRFIPSVI